MIHASRRVAGLTAAAAAAALLALAAPSTALAAKGGNAEPGKGKGSGPLQSVQLLSFNDYHGHLESPDTDDFYESEAAGGGEYLATMLDQLREDAPKGRSLTVAAGDLIGGSPFLSGLFHDEPSVESLEAMGLDVSSVGNHEFDEGTDELLRMQYGGCHPVDGCYFADDPYDGAGFSWLAANVVNKDGSGTLLPGTTIKKVAGMKIGFIGMTLEDTPTLVSPVGVASVDFLDEVETANAEAAKLQRRGVEAIVVLLHEGGIPVEGGVSDCDQVSDPIETIAEGMDPAIDMLVTGHTHQPYVCAFDDPDGDPRLVTSAASYGRVVTETTLVIDRRTGDVDRGRTTAVNHIVEDVDPDPSITAIVEKWDALSGPLAARVVGSVDEDITGDESGDRGIETPMGDLVADAILWGTDDADEGGAEIAFMNIGGVRASLLLAPKYEEADGEVTYAEAYDVNPFGNLIVTVDMTGADIEAALEQQYVADRRRPNLALGVSEGFSYTWDATQPEGSKVVEGSMMLNGEPIDPAGTYRVAMYNFLAGGGDSFTAFTNGTDLLGGPEDLANFVAYLEANPGLTAPEDRVAGL
ncbi:bifunctional metallophosphatase/5'-nucleotidase [Demequina sp. SYSU T00192]|uniref:Bifunctional metallophosphatase/5'-nucleotidase n=1 Tax=Demequina litoralis TaxID=3051660 RepID=A0ABT8GBY6_9MICO|nr:bifunctional metallophosphatase/5'-nucleotidase [Demequina sp. SYSU T00192]MDN4476657.1 bifunctional metallophosphatase/5'-nucleotidase [Demequina sp. SYSU T00192]